MRGYIREWTLENAPLIWVEMIWYADVVLMPKLFRFSFGEHRFESTNRSLTYFSNRREVVRVRRLGRTLYNNLPFMRRFLRKTRAVERKLVGIVRGMAPRELRRMQNRSLAKLLRSFHEVYAMFVALYRFTRPTFYEDQLSVIQKQLPAPRNDNLALLLRPGSRRTNFRISARLRTLTDLLRTVGARRLAMHDVYQSTFQRAAPLFREIGKRLSLSADEAKHCTLAELTRGLEGGTVDRREVLRRLREYRFVYTKSGFRIIVGRYRKGSNDRLRARVLKGQTAYPGLVRGKVRIIPETLEGKLHVIIRKMRKGEILVTDTTSPDMLLAIRKAGAIVANAGGMLSHAAVVAREFKIPCVIATNVATQVLKDGDRIEVDATKGFVKKL